MKQLRSIMMGNAKIINSNLPYDLKHLRDELAKRAFDSTGKCIDATLAEVVFKINSCLFSGYT